MTTTTLIESQPYQHTAVDEGQGIIRGVKVLGLTSKNGRRYLPAAIDRALPLYEGVRVNLNHARPGQSEARPLADRFGILKGAKREADGLYADLHYLRTHPSAATIAEAAQRMPETLGLSHHADGKVRQDGAEVLVEEIVAVRSVDLVTDPATTHGLFESRDPTAELVEENRRLKADAESRQLLTEASIPADANLVACMTMLPNQAARQQLVEAIARLPRTPAQPKPLSTPRNPADQPLIAFTDPAAFARAITSP